MYGYGYGNWDGGMMGYGGWGHPFGWIFMILFWVVVVVGVVALIRWMGGMSTHHLAPPKRTALDILHERYARGEIEQQEYKQKKADLEH